MELRRLPYDTIRPILLRLDTIALALLNATLNRSLQRMISSSDTLDTVSFGDGKELSGELRYLLRSLRNVRHACFENGAKLSLHDLSALRTLNPLTITLDMLAISNSAMDSFDAHYKGRQSSESDPLCHNLSWSLLPNFRHLTPRLEALDLRGFPPAVNDAVRRQHSLQEPFFLLPSTLTSFTLWNHPGDRFLLQVLPPSLRTLDVTCWHGSDYWTRDLRRLSQLEHLTLDLWRFGLGQDLILPPTLISACFTLAELPNVLLDSLRATSNLTSLKLHLKQRNQSGFTIREDMFPPTLTELSLLSFYSYSPAPEFPRQLVSLTLDHAPTEAWSNIANLTALQTLIINQGYYLLNDSDTPWTDYSTTAYLSSRLLPSSLTHLELPCTHITEPAIQHLPKGLTSLSVRDFDLAYIRILETRAKKWHFIIRSPIDLRERRHLSAIDATNFAELWCPTLDSTRWLNGVSSHYASLNVHFTVKEDDGPPMHVNYAKSPQTKTMILSEPRYCAGPQLSGAFKICLTSVLPALPQLTTFIVSKDYSQASSIQLGWFPSSITHLELGLVPIVWSYTIKPKLQYLSFNNKITIRSTDESYSQTVFGSLRHLDAPNLSLHLLGAVDWRWTGMSKLRAQFDGLEDLHIVDFLTKTIDAVTRSSMTATLSYMVTGALLPDSGPSAVNTIDADIIKAQTEQIVISHLSEPMPSKLSFFGSSPHQFDPNGADSVVETIGSVLTSIRVSEEQASRFVIPNSATEATIKPTTSSWTLAQRDYKTNTLRSPTAFPPGLVRLELVGVTQPSLWWHFLPATLRYLRIESITPLPLFGASTFPPNIETLSLESSGMSDFRGNRLPFSLEALPASLERLALVSPCMRLSTPDETSKLETSHLKKLHWIFLSEPAYSTAYELYQLVANNPDPKFEIESFFVESKGRKRQAYELRTSSMQGNPNNVREPSRRNRATLGLVQSSSSAQRASNISSNGSASSTSMALSSTNEPLKLDNVDDLLAACPAMLVKPSGHRQDGLHESHTLLLAHPLRALDAPIATPHVEPSSATSLSFGSRATSVEMPAQSVTSVWNKPSSSSASNYSTSSPPTRVKPATSTVKRPVRRK